MYQQEIQFFWPLTEQIPLELDYTDCRRPIVQKVGVTTINGGTSITMASPTWTTVATFSGPIETPELVMKLDKRPNIMVKFLYKLLNIKWKLK